MKTHLIDINQKYYKILETTQTHTIVEDSKGSRITLSNSLVTEMGFK